MAKYLDYAGLGTLVGQIKALINEKTSGIASDAALSAVTKRLEDVEKLIDSDKDGAINKFIEIVAFLEGIEDTKTLAPIIADVAANKTKLAGIEAGAQKNTVSSVNGKTGAVTIDIPTTLKNPNALTVTLNSGTTEGTNKFTYDGSAAKSINITPASIGAQAAGSYLTSHQTINAATFAAGTFTAKTYNPKSAAATINVPTKTSHLSNDSGFITESDIVAITDAEITALFS